MPSNGPKPAKDVTVHIILVPDNTPTTTPVFDLNGALTPGAERDVRQCAQGTSTSPLKRTDIVVFQGAAWQAANGNHLMRHPAVHLFDPQTVLELHRRNVDRVVWWSETEFVINSIHSHVLSAPVQNPFYSLPMTNPEEDGSGNPIFVARSLVHMPSADGQRFKINFTINNGGTNQVIDPDMDCMV